MIAVLDASAAVRLAHERETVPSLVSALREARLVMAPDLIVPEVTNAAWKYSHSGLLSKSDSQELMNAALALVDRFVPTLGLSQEALSVAQQARRPACDMFYVVLARRAEGTLVTLDRGLARFAESIGQSAITA